MPLSYEPRLLLPRSTLAVRISAMRTKLLTAGLPTRYSAIPADANLFRRRSPVQGLWCCEKLGRARLCPPGGVVADMHAEVLTPADGTQLKGRRHAFMSLRHRPSFYAFKIGLVREWRYLHDTAIKFEHGWGFLDVSLATIFDLVDLQEDLSLSSKR